MPACEYCGEHFPKGGAYSTHVRYCDEKPDPDAADGLSESDSEPVSTGERLDLDNASDGSSPSLPEPSQTGSGGQSDDPDGAESGDVETFELNAEEIGEMLEAEREQARQELEPVEVESTTEPADAGGGTDDLGQCPECGGEMMPGKQLWREVGEAATDHDGWAKWYRANTGTPVDRACTDPSGCGYYVTPGEEPAQFETPGGSGAGWLALGLGAAGAIGLAALGAANDDTQNAGAWPSNDNDVF